MSAKSTLPGPLRIRRESEMDPYSPSTIWGRKMLVLLDRIAAADVPVLILGETGVGKEVLARTLHAKSARANEPFLKLNCAALPSELIESELFGYARGAFTGAFKSTRGKFELAEGGTILLDEIGDMDLKLQSKLLQVLQDSQFLPLGGTQEVSINVRVIAATHQDLPRAVRMGMFRQDLYYRLNVVKITVPPLRERLDEILPLIEVFLRRYSAEDELPPPLPVELTRALLLYSWPGNIRELENAIRKFVVLGQPETLMEDLANCCAETDVQTREHPARGIPPLIKNSALDLADASGPAMPRLNTNNDFIRMPFGSIPFEALRPTFPASLEPAANILGKVGELHRQAEAEAILKVLNATQWNRKQTAEVLKIDYKALLYKMKKLGISRKSMV